MQLMVQENYNISKVTLRRRMFMFGAATGTVMGIISTWLDWRSGLVSSLPQDITLALVLSPLFFWAWKTTDPTSPARVGMLVFTLSFIPSIPNELVQMPVFLLWLPAVSLLSFYFFGFREGLIWATGFLTIVLIESIWVLSAVPEPQFESMFVMAIIIYLFLSGTAAAFQYLLESYEQKLLLESEERQAVSERMAEMQKLETIGVLAGGIAHDFNNLLVGVMGNAELAMLDAPRDGVEHYHLGQIVKSAQRGADLVRQMLAYSGQGQVSMGQQNLNILLRDISELLAAVVDKKIRLDQSLMKDLPDIYGDKNQLTQLLMNLITNASEAMQEKTGDIVLRTDVCRLSNQEITGMYMPSHAKAGDFVLIEVKDSGCGMDKQTQSRIFDPFFTTKKTGTGLGLAALLGIVRSHGGVLSLDSAPGEGSCFSIFFPLAVGRRNTEKLGVSGGIVPTSDEM
jgi:signal transduction histidine kinase